MSSTQKCEMSLLAKVMSSTKVKPIDLIKEKKSLQNGIFLAFFFIWFLMDLILYVSRTVRSLVSPLRGEPSYETEEDYCPPGHRFSGLQRNHHLFDDSLTTGVGHHSHLYR